MTLCAVPVNTTGRVECMRQIRNSGSPGYAHFNARITIEQQKAWWEANRRFLRAWLYLNESEMVVGFGLLTRHDDGHWWSTVGVLPEHNGRNYGKEITADLVRRSPTPIRGAARRDNPAAVRLHVAALWDVVDGPDPRLVYFRAKVREGVPA